MTHIKDVFGRDLQIFDKVFVGFDEQVKRLQQVHDDMTKNIPNYPPHNIKKIDDTKYVIEMAVAGFGKSDIEVEMIDDKLVIRGNLRNDERDYPYLWQGIANRAFTRMFALGDHIEVKNAALVNGMLKVMLEKMIPEHKKPKKIDITDGDEAPTVSEFAQHNPPQFLVEDEGGVK
jgi:molecular chaperone IbpA